MQEMEQMSLGEGSPRLLVVSRAASAIAAVLAALALIGWAMDLPLLRSGADGRVSMNPTTAIVLLVAAAAAFMLTIAGRRVVAALPGAGVALFGLLKLVSYVTDLNLGFDRALFREKVDVVVASFPNRMAPSTAVAFVVLGVALVLFGTARGAGTGQVLTVMAALVALEAIVDYLFNFKSPGLGPAIPMALNTAVALLLLAGSLLFLTARSGWIAVSATKSLAGGIIGTAYSQTLQATGGTASYVYHRVSWDSRLVDRESDRERGPPAGGTALSDGAARHADGRDHRVRRGGESDALQSRCT